MAGRGIVLAFVLLFACAALAAAKGTSRGSVLVLVDDIAAKKTHKKFLKHIEDLGFETTVELGTSDKVQLKSFDSWLFDKLVILGGVSKFGQGVTASLQLEFFNSGHDVFVALDQKASSSTRALMARFGIDLELSKSSVLDHFNFHKKLDQGNHTTVVSSVTMKNPAIFRDSTLEQEIAFRGIGFSVSPESSMVISVLNGRPTAYSGEPGKGTFGPTVLGGFNLKLGALVQGHNNARVAVLGSLDMVSDAYLSGSKGNLPFMEDVLSWTFQLKGVLKASNLRHRVIGGEISPARYRVKDDVEIAVDIEECDVNGCRPFGGKDVQMEFVMLDPYIRTTLTNQGNGSFSSHVKVPDVYGVFKWVLDYKRPGYTRLYEVETVPVRPFRHDEYPRFLTQAYPYYGAVISMMVGFFTTGIFFLYSK